MKLSTPNFKDLLELLLHEVFNLLIVGSSLLVSNNFSTENFLFKLLEQELLIVKLSSIEIMIMINLQNEK
jgi:hypothetical protein